jgi:peptidoglycan/LPS O-acetylase OafA/YrhL
LSSKPFVHINKLIYAIYLLNPVVVTLVFGTPENPLSMDLSSMYAGAIVVTVITYILAVVSTTLFELPFSKLTGEFFSKK